MRLLIVDDHEIVRRGIRSLLSEAAGWDVCGEAVDGQDALDKARQLRPDVIIMDVSMPRLNGLEATRQVRGILPECEVLVLSQHENPEMARQALKAGARGYVVKSSISRDLLSAVAKTSRREYFFDPAILDQTTSSHTDVQEILHRSVAFERALRDSEERLGKLAEYQSAVMTNMAEGLYAVDENGLLTSINPAGEAILGWKRDELIGKKMHDVTHYKHPDGSPFPASDCPGLQVVQKGIALREHEDTFVRKDGSFVPVVFSASPLKEDGKIAGVIVSFRDDTEQRRAREALQHSREQLSLALHSSRTALFDWDLVEQRGKWNPQMAAIYEFTPKGDYISVAEWMSLFHPDDAGRLAEEAERIWRGKDEEFTFEFRTVRHNGETRWILSHGRVVRAPDGKAVRMIGTHTDITAAKSSEEALKKSESQLRAAFSQSYSFLVLLQSDGTIIEANRAALDAAGATDPSQVVGRKFWEPWWSPLPQEVAVLKDLIPKVAKGQTARNECLFCLPDGTRRIGDRTLSPVLDKRGDVSMIIATGLDITERKQSEAIVATGARQQKALFHLADELHRASSMEEIYKAALNAILDALQCNRASILLCDDRGLMRFKNWRGLSSDYRRAVDGHSAWRPDEMHPQPICISDISTADFSQSLKTTVKKEGIGALAFIPLVSKGRLCGKFMAYFNTPHTFTDDEIEVSLTIARQLTFAIERMQGIDALGKSDKATALLAAIVASSDDAIISKNLDGIITSWNKGAEHIFGYTAEEAIGKHITLIIPMARLAEEEEILSRLRRGEKIDHFQTVRQRKDGVMIDVSLTISPVQDSSGRVIGASKVARDITAQKRTAEKIRIADESLRLMRVQDEERRRIAREFHDSAGQTLTVLGLNLAQLVQDAEVIAPELAKEGKEIEKVVQQLHREIRTTSYLLHPPLLDEAGLRSAVSWYVQGVAERSGIAIDLSISDDLGRLPADMELAIFRIVQECLTNIHRHAESKTAFIRMAREDGSVYVEVRDEGKGISPERLAEIQSRGSGVGIAGIRERLRQFGGEMNIEASASGTRVIARIPQPTETAPTQIEPCQASV